MTFMSNFLTLLAGVVALASVAIYFFGIPPELKRAMEKKALQTMGENKASYMLKDQISKVPASDQEDVKDLKSGLGNVLGGATQNRAGEEGGELADQLSSPFTGR